MEPLYAMVWIARLSLVQVGRYRQVVPYRYRYLLYGYRRYRLVHG